MKSHMNCIARTYIALVVVVLASQESTGQEKGRPASRRAQVSQEVGDSTITISYSRPAVNRREIWGGLLPFGENWTLGTNEKTTITFEEDVEINGIRLATGTYGVYVYLVNDRDWQLVFSGNATGDAQRYDKADDVLRIAVRPEDAPRQKRLKMGIENIEEREDSHEADLYLHWEKKKAALRLRMTGERRGKGLEPVIPEDAKPAWAVVESSLDGLIAENFVLHTRDFSEDFETDFGDGGSAAAHVQLLRNLRSGGLTEGMDLNLENLEIELGENEVTFKKVIVYSTLGTLDLTYVLRKHGEEWRVTYLSSD